MGTPLELSFEKITGALFSKDSAIKVRVDAKIAEFPAESTAEKMTPFIKWAAEERPAFCNINVNGEILIKMKIQSRCRYLRHPAVVDHRAVSLAP